MIFFLIIISVILYSYFASLAFLFGLFNFYSTLVKIFKMIITYYILCKGALRRHDFSSPLLRFVSSGMGINLTELYAIW